MEILNSIYYLLLSTRAKAIYWNIVYIAGVGIVNLFLENVMNLGLPAWTVVLLGAILTQISKGLKNRSQGTPMGWAN